MTIDRSRNRIIPMDKYTECYFRPCRTFQRQLRHAWINVEFCPHLVHGAPHLVRADLGGQFG
jgi:hypothetical protein